MNTENGAVPRPGTEGPEGSQVVDSILQGIYARGAGEYYDAGWHGVIPLIEYQGDFNPVVGFTGDNHNYPTREQIAKWMVEYPNNPLVLRPGDDVIGIDIDWYRRGTRATPARDASDALHDSLMTTKKSTSRMPDDTISGILWYRVEPGKLWRSNYGEYIDIVRRGHRFGVVWPSISKRTGKTVQWYDAGEIEPLPRVPRVDELSWLPDHIVEMLELTVDEHGFKHGSRSGGLMESDRLDLGEIYEGLSEGERDNKLFAYACSLRSRNPKMTKEEAYLQVEHWGSVCTPAFPVEWSRRKVDQAWKYPPGMNGNGNNTTPASQELVDWAKKFSGTVTTGSEQIGSGPDSEPDPEPEPFILSSQEVRNRPKLKWQIDGIMPERSLWQAFGPTGSFKTFIIIDMLNQLANGPAGNFLGHDILTDGPGLCCMVLGEGGGDIAERQEAWCLAHPGLTDENTFFVIDKDINLLDVADVNRLGEELVKVSVARGLPWRCIVFDTQADHLPTGDERNEATFSELKPKLLHISRQLNISVGLVHHTGHNEDRERGSSRQRQMLDVVMNIDGSKIVAEKVKAGPKFDDIPYITRSIGDSLVVAQPTDMDVVNTMHQKIKKDAVALVAYMEKTQSPDYILDDLKKGLGWGRPRVLAAVEMAHEFVHSVKVGRSYTFTLIGEGS